MNIIILGPQGSGKGTQAKLLAEKYGLTNISSGKLLREFAKGDSEKAKLIADLLTTGALLPFDTVMEVIEPAMVGSKSGFILDGSPRDLMQAEYLDWFLGERHITIDKVIHIDIPREESLNRLAKRAITENRSDDTPDAIHERLDIYEKDTMPVIDYYRKQGKMIDVDGVGEVPEIFNAIISKLEVSSRA